MKLDEIADDFDAWLINNEEVFLLINIYYISLFYSWGITNCRTNIVLIFFITMVNFLSNNTNIFIWNGLQKSDKEMFSLVPSWNI